MPPTISDSKCILVTGATSGIGRALAISLAHLPSKPQVVATGRRQERLDALKTAEGIEGFHMDVDSDSETIQKYVDDLIKAYPEMDTIILNAGTQFQFHFSDRIDLSKLKSEFNVNYLSIVTMIDAFLPHFRKLVAQGRPCFIIPVSSGIAVSPVAHVPNYSATKAALHALCVALRIQLKDTNIHLIEIMPPLVESEIHDAQGITEMLSKFWQPIDEFTAETLAALKQGLPTITPGMAQKMYEDWGKASAEDAEKKGYYFKPQ